jgi:hydrogenase nickel incorporation protein HypB
MRDVAVEQKVLGRNDLVAQRNRERFKSLGAYVVNLISSPGAGKTTLLEATLRQLAQKLSVAVIEGDVQTDNDARRVAATGVPVEAVVTGGACHLDASMVGRAFAALEPKLGGALDLLIVENVGNLVCPASYDVGEDEKIALVSVTEGEDKPVKYPALFHAAKTCLVTKIDLLPHLDFDYDALLRNTRAVNPELKIFALSARTGEGMAEWLSYLAQMTNRSNP